MVIGVKQGPLGKAVGVYWDSFQEMSGLLDACEDSPRPVLGQRAGGNLCGYFEVGESFLLENFLGSKEVHICGASILDLFLCRHLKLSHDGVIRRPVANIVLASAKSWVAK